MSNHKVNQEGLFEIFQEIMYDFSPLNIKRLELLLCELEKEGIALDQVKSIDKKFNLSEYLLNFDLMTVWFKICLKAGYSEILERLDSKVLKRIGRMKYIRPLYKSLLSMDKGLALKYKHKGYFSMNMATTRGCPFKCNWCAKPIYGNRYNSRSPQNVVAELKLLKQKFNFDHIWFCDDIFGLKPGWVPEFATCLEKEKLSFRFKIQARADLLLQENYIRDLARAGCENAWMGAESGSQKILDAMDKGTTVEQIYLATHLLKKHNIHPSFFIQFGYPGETKEDIIKTIRMINRLVPYEIGISVSYPLPGTAFFEKVKTELKEKTNWTDSDELALMFHNTYAPAFYKQLHRYVHKSYRKQIALQHLKKLLAKPFGSNPLTIKKALSFLYYAPACWMARQKLTSLENIPA